MAESNQSYPHLREFLAAWFAEADHERRDDVDVITAFRRVHDAPYRAAVVREGRAFLARRRPPWRALAAAANRRFSGGSAFADWLKDVIEALDR
jgi:hypothetical protein